MVHRHGFLCATPGAELSIGFQQSLGAGIFGGAGFRLQKLTGNATAWIELSGEVITYDLKPGRNTPAYTPATWACSSRERQFRDHSDQGCERTSSSGRMAFFWPRSTGPGKIWLQSLPLPNLAHALSEYIVVREGEAVGVGAVAGGILKGLSK